MIRFIKPLKIASLITFICLINCQSWAQGNPGKNRIRPVVRNIKLNTKSSNEGMRLEANSFELSSDADLIMESSFWPKNYKIDFLKGGVVFISILLLIGIKRQLDYSNKVSQLLQMAESENGKTKSVNMNNAIGLLASVSETEDHAQEEVEGILRNISNYDRKWLERVKVIMDEQIDNSAFTQEALASELALSKRQLQRRIKKITGETVNEFWTNIRLRKSLDLIETGKYSNIKEISRRVGYKSTSHFQKLFQTKFGQSVSHLL